MAKYTGNYGLIKPTDNDNFDIANSNENMDIIDTEIKKVNDKFDDIQIGGRNILLNSDNGYLNNLGIFAFPNVTHSITEDGWKRLSIKEQLVNREIVQDKWVKISKIGYYTESIYIRTDGNIDSAYFSFFTLLGHGKEAANIESCGNKIYRLYATKKITDLNNPVRVVDLSEVRTSNATYLDFKYPKFEKGKFPTDYSKAPEDYEYEISNLQNQIDNILKLLPR